MRHGPWMVIRQAPGAALERYEVTTNHGEVRDVSAANPDVVARMGVPPRTAHTGFAEFPIRPAKH